MPTVAPIAALPPTPRETYRLGLKATAQEAPQGTYLGPSDPVSQNFGGVEYSPLTVGNTRTGSFDPCQDTGITFEQRDGTVTFVPWGIYVWEDCPVLGGDFNEVAARTVDRLERNTSFFAEQVFWTGELDVGSDVETMAATVTPNADNRRLSSNDATLIDGVGAHDLTDAFGYINEWAAATAGGERLWIHVEPRLLPFIAFYGGGFRTNVRRLEQALSDHYIVAGQGYDGSGPTAQDGSTGTGESWIYVTTPVRFIESPVDVPSDPEQWINRNTNRYEIVASRMVLAEFDLTVHGAIKVCLPEPGPDCSSTGS